MMQQIPFALPHRAAMGADDFLVTSSNHDAHAWIERWPAWPCHGLIVSGGVGGGKTHLLSLWRERSDAVAVTPNDLRQPVLLNLGEGAAVAIDDADMIAGNVNAEENLFHLYNRVQAGRGHLLLTMKNPAAQAGFILPDLRSRLMTLPVAALGAPDDALLAALIVKQFRDRQVDLDAGVVAYLAARAARDAGSIRDLVEKLDQAAWAHKGKISLTRAREILEGADD